MAADDLQRPADATVRDAGAMRRRFSQVDVFTAVAYRGNPLAVVVDGDWARTRRDATVRELDEPLGDDVPAPADEPRRRLPRADLHDHLGAALRRPPDARLVPRLARLGRRGRGRRRRRAGVRRRAGSDPPERREAGLRRAAAVAIGSRRRRPARPHRAHRRLRRDRRGVGRQRTRLGGRAVAERRRRAAPDARLRWNARPQARRGRACAAGSRPRLRGARLLPRHRAAWPRIPSRAASTPRSHNG